MSKIMIVDDSAYARRVHRGLLEAMGHSVLDVATGMGALETFYLERPDVVLLDLSMADIGGIDVLRKIREIDPAARVVVITADVQRSTTDAVMAAGAFRFLSKPVNADALRAILAEPGERTV